jgi:hypothetical protein
VPELNAAQLLPAENPAFKTALWPTCGCRPEDVFRLDHSPCKFETRSSDFPEGAFERLPAAAPSLADSLRSFPKSSKRKRDLAGQP